MPRWMHDTLRVMALVVIGVLLVMGLTRLGQAIFTGPSAYVRCLAAGGSYADTEHGYSCAQGLGQ